MRFLVAVALMLSPIQAHALSCMRWDAASAYSQAAAAEERYLIVLGSFLRNGPDQPLRDRQEGDAQPVPYSYEALFYGDIASRVGFRTPTELDVTISVTCAAVWCGAEPQDGQQVLAFLQVDNDRNYSLVSGPCPFALIPDPGEADLDQIIACMRDETCEPGF